MGAPYIYDISHLRVNPVASASFCRKVKCLITTKVTSYRTLLHWISLVFISPITRWIVVMGFLRKNRMNEDLKW